MVKKLALGVTSAQSRPIRKSSSWPGGSFVAWFNKTKLATRAMSVPPEDVRSGAGASPLLPKVEEMVP